MKIKFQQLLNFKNIFTRIKKFLSRRVRDNDVNILKRNIGVTPYQSNKITTLDSLLGNPTPLNSPTPFQFNESTDEEVWNNFQHKAGNQN